MRGDDIFVLILVIVCVAIVATIAVHSRRQPASRPDDEPQS